MRSKWVEVGRKLDAKCGRDRDYFCRDYSETVAGLWGEFNGNISKPRHMLLVGDAYNVSHRIRRTSRRERMSSICSCHVFRVLVSELVVNFL